jgi:hypothetical protein
MQMSSTCAHGTKHEQAERNSPADPLRPARGIMLGCAIGAGLWAAGIVAIAIA